MRYSDEHTSLCAGVHGGAGSPLHDATYDEWSVRLDPGDILLFYSDGITEASNRDGKFFGGDRLKSLLAANTHLSSTELADRILEEVQEYTQGGAITDDRTLVVMKVK